MADGWGRGVVVGGVAVSIVIGVGGHPAAAQTQLPEIVVNAPSPIVRARPRPAAPTSGDGSRRARGTGGPSRPS